MKQIILCLLLIGFSFQLEAQKTENFYPCGSNQGRSEWLQAYQRNPTALQQQLLQERQRGGTLYIPMSLHIVTLNNGSGGATLQAVFASFCQLNVDFAPVGIQFYIKDSIRYINDSEFYVHDSVPAGGLKMLQHNVDSTINVYFVSSPAGNCGYNVPYAGVAMNNGCLSGHTFAHELGHNLGLPHTFLGWEGGQGWNGPAQTNFPNPAPLQVTINYTHFKDTFYVDTLIIDTILVEKVARTGPTANCNVAADGFCDTPTDYLAYRWQCNASNMSITQQLDPDSVSFISDGTYIMSYSFDNCQQIFSQEQANAMYLDVVQNHPELIPAVTPNFGPVSSVGLTPIQPASGSIVGDNAPRFKWNAVANASHYLIEVYKEPYSQSQIMDRAIVTDTFFQSIRNYPPRPASFPYAYRILPYNLGSTCAGYTVPVNFNTVLTVGTELVQEATDLVWNIYPNPTNNGRSIQVNISSTKALGNTQLSIYNTLGQQLWSAPELMADGENQLEIFIPANWTAGLYFVELKSQAGTRSVQKLWISQ